jgi:kinesin family protein C2/C3
MDLYEKRLDEKSGEIEHLKTSMQQETCIMEQKLAAAEKEISRLEEVKLKYKKSQKENRELYNMVQDLRGNIRVYCRVRPCGVGAADDSPSVIQTDEEEGRLAAYSSKHSKWNEFQFDRVFGEESNQEHIYRETKPLIRSVLDGYSVCIFAYGQTGAGKTHTMTGTSADPGINPRTLEDLFELKQERSNEEDYSFRLQLLEIYNETIRDLLSDNQETLKIVATRGSGSNVPGATQVDVSSASDVFRILEMGSRNRAVGQTNMNDRSSRSHQGEHSLTKTIMMTDHIAFYALMKEARFV